MKCLVILVIFYMTSVLSHAIKSDLIDNKSIIPIETSSIKMNRLIREHWIEQDVDHFDESNTQKWNMRYFSNNKFHVVGGPIFVIAGGSEPIDASLMSGGMVFDMANEMNGMIFLVEHRFYGRSQPMPDSTISNLERLTVDQAIEDLAHFIQVQKSTLPGSSKSAVILVGSSYAGSLVTWFKQKYPALVTGVWSSSAPLLAKFEFPEFLEKTSSGMKSFGGEQCHARIMSAFEQMEAEIANGVSTNIMNYFNLCSLIPTSILDVGAFFNRISGMISGMVQNRVEGQIESVCAKVTDSSITNDVEALGNALIEDRDNCLDLRYSAIIEPYRNTNIESNEAINQRHWLYQTCNEFGWFVTTNSNEQPFGTRLPIELHIQMCLDLFGNRFVANEIISNVQRTNEKYNGRAPDVSDIIFTNGDMDPWAPVTVNDGLNNQVTTVLIEGYSHASDLLSLSDADSVQLQNTKSMIKAKIREWIKM